MNCFNLGSYYHDSPLSLANIDDLLIGDQSADHMDSDRLATDTFGNGGLPSTH